MQRIKQGQVHTTETVNFELLLILAVCFIPHATFTLRSSWLIEVNEEGLKNSNLLLQAGTCLDIMLHKTVKKRLDLNLQF